MCWDTQHKHIQLFPLCFMAHGGPPKGVVTDWVSKNFPYCEHHISTCPHSYQSQIFANSLFCASEEGYWTGAFYSQRVRSQQLSTLAAEVLNALPTTSYHFPPVFSMLVCLHIHVWVRWSRTEEQAIIWLCTYDTIAFFLSP